jgi:formylglycine-generating enzyme required for sulfatase activity
MGQQWQLSRDRRWLEGAYPGAAKIAAMIRYYRTTPPPHYVKATSLEFGDALPPDAPSDKSAQKRQILQPGACDGFNPNYTEAFDVAGTRAAAIMARALGKTEEAQAWEQLAASLMEKYDQRFGTNLPAGYGSYSVLWPCRLYSLQEGKGFEQFEGFGVQNLSEWRYFALATAHQGLLCGNREAGYGTLEKHLAHEQMKGWYAFDEGGGSGQGGWKYYRTKWNPSVAMPHGWAIAELWLLLRDCLAFEDGERLVLLGGVPPDWFQQNMAIEHLPTQFGDCSVQYVPATGGATLRFSGSARPPGGFVLRLPASLAASLSADGKPARQSGRGDWVIPAETQRVSLKFAPAARTASSAMPFTNGLPTLNISGQTISGPAKGSDSGAWLEAMRRWREQELARMHYNGREYDRPELAWTRRSFIQAQMMVEDRYFYDPVKGCYTVDRYLDDLEARYGGLDSVLIWPVYPNIGIDNRNQHDMLRAMPGGLAGVKQMVADFHRRGVRVLFPEMPWDAGGRVEGVPLWEAVARDMKAVGADGINGDAQPGVRREFLTASMAVGHPLAFEPENNMGDIAMLQWNHMDWGYWPYPAIPEVSKYKWLESRHLTHVCERWARDRSAGLQATFFNGVGYVAWENIWGVWNQVTPRDAAAIRRIRLIEHATADLLCSPDWEPHVRVLQDEIFASRFPGSGRSVWLLVNSGTADKDGRQLRVLYREGTRYYDLWNAVRLKPEVDGNTAALAFKLEGRSYGAVLAVDPGQPNADIEAVLPRLATLAKTPLKSLSAEWHVLPQRIVEIHPTAPARTAPPGMVQIPAGKFRFQVSGVEIEGWGCPANPKQPGTDVQCPWEDLPRMVHDRELDMKSFYIDRFPVTNDQFKKFLDATGYQPRDAYNFLKDWKNGTYQDGLANKPVTWVSIEDAREYARWAGKRLPHEWEWQYAAQGTDGRPFPWGDQDNPEARPKPDEGHDLRGPTDVDAFPKGASPFGVMDMIGNVWQWTDEYVDEHTRAAVVRGGGYYRPAGAAWYFPRNTKLSQHGKYLLMAPCKDRSGCVGFRCVVDT